MIILPVRSSAKMLELITWWKKWLISVPIFEIVHSLSPNCSSKIALVGIKKKLTVKAIEIMLKNIIIRIPELIINELLTLTTVGRKRMFFSVRRTRRAIKRYKTVKVRGGYARHGGYTFCFFRRFY